MFDNENTFCSVTKRHCERFNTNECNVKYLPGFVGTCFSAARSPAGDHSSPPCSSCSPHQAVRGCADHAPRGRRCYKSPRATRDVCTPPRDRRVAAQRGRAERETFQTSGTVVEKKKKKCVCAIRPLLLRGTRTKISGIRCILCKSARFVLPGSHLGNKNS